MWMIWWMIFVFGGGLFSDLDLENSLGGEREGEWGIEGNFMLRGQLWGLISGLLGLFSWEFFYGVG